MPHDSSSCLLFDICTSFGRRLSRANYNRKTHLTTPAAVGTAACGKAGSDHFIFLALVILRYTSIVIHLPFGIEFRNRRASRHRNIDRLLRRVAPLNLATCKAKALQLHWKRTHWQTFSDADSSSRALKRSPTLTLIFRRLKLATACEGLTLFCITFNDLSSPKVL